MTQWKHSSLDAALAGDAGGSEGVYMLARVERVSGVPLRVEPLYIGKTLRRFAARLAEHVDPWRSHSSELNERLRGTDLRGLELWVRRAPRDQVAKLERQLIRQLQPTLNKIRYIKDETDGE